MSQHRIQSRSLVADESESSHTPFHSMWPIVTPRLRPLPLREFSKMLQFPRPLRFSKNSPEDELESILSLYLSIFSHILTSSTSSTTDTIDTGILYVPHPRDREFYLWFLDCPVGLDAVGFIVVEEEGTEEEGRTTIPIGDSPHRHARFVAHDGIVDFGMMDLFEHKRNRKKSISQRGLLPKGRRRELKVRFFVELNERAVYSDETVRVVFVEEEEQLDVEETHTVNVTTVNDHPLIWCGLVAPVECRITNVVFFTAAQPGEKSACRCIRILVRVWMNGREHLRGKWMKKRSDFPPPATPPAIDPEGSPNRFEYVKGGDTPRMGDEEDERNAFRGYVEEYAEVWVDETRQDDLSFVSLEECRFEQCGEDMAESEFVVRNVEIRNETLETGECSVEIKFGSGFFKLCHALLSQIPQQVLMEWRRMDRNQSSLVPENRFGFDAVTSMVDRVSALFPLYKDELDTVSVFGRLFQSSAARPEAISPLKFLNVARYSNLTELFAAVFLSTYSSVLEDRPSFSKDSSFSHELLVHRGPIFAIFHVLGKEIDLFGRTLRQRFQDLGWVGLGTLYDEFVMQDAFVLPSSSASSVASVSETAMRDPRPIEGSPTTPTTPGSLLPDVVEYTSSPTKSPQKNRKDRLQELAYAEMRAEVRGKARGGVALSMLSVKQTDDIQVALEAMISEYVKEQEKLRMGENAAKVAKLEFELLKAKGELLSSEVGAGSTVFAELENEVDRLRQTVALRRQDIDRFSRLNSPLPLSVVDWLHERLQSVARGGERTESFSGLSLSQLVEKKNLMSSRRLQDYERVECIAKNGIDAVWKARLKSSSEEEGETDELALDFVVLKIVKLPADKPRVCERVMNEIRILSSLRHPNIVQIKSVMLNRVRGGGEIAVFEMDFLEKNLLFWLKGISSKAGLSSEAAYFLETKRSMLEIRLVFYKLLTGLSYLHAHNIAHRDLAFSNVLINEGSTDPVIIDFGLSKDEHRMFTTSLGTTEAAKSSLRYKPPNESVTRRTDMWSFGKMLFESLARQEHIPALDSASDAFLPPAELPYLSHSEKDILSLCLASDPRERISAVDALQHPFFDFSSLGAGDPVVMQKRLSAERLGIVARCLGAILRQTPVRGRADVRLNRTDPHSYKGFLFRYYEVTDFASLIKPFHVRYIGEHGIDAGGLARDVYAFVTKEFARDNLLMPDGEDCASFLDTVDSTNICYAMGCLVLKAVVRKIALDLRLSSFVYHFLLHDDDWVTNLSREEVRFFVNEIDISYYSTLERDILLKDVRKIPFRSCYTFVSSDGEDVILSNSNKQRFVDYRCRSKLFGTNFRLENLKAFRRGFWHLATQDVADVLHTLNGFELQRVVQGSDEVDPEKLISQFVYPSFMGRHQTRVARWLERFLRLCDNVHRRNFLRLSCALSNLPHDGMLERQIRIGFRPGRTLFGRTCTYAAYIGEGFRSYDEFEAGVLALLGNVEFVGFEAA